MSSNARIQTALRNEWSRTIDHATNTDYGQMYRERLMDYRKSPEAVVKVDKPLNILRARGLGYKAKPGIIVARVRIRRGGGMFLRPRRARKPKRMGIRSMTRKKNIQWMAEERANKRFPNLEVLNSYAVGQDGKNKYYEVILIDPASPSIQSDKDLNWVCESQHGGRVYRGKTSAGRKSRGLKNNPAGSRGTEKIRPSLRANDRKGR